MAGKMIAIANMKGGVGKTTTVVSLAEALAADDPSKSILVIDLDPQASASVCLAGEGPLNEMIKTDRTIDALLDERFITKKKTTLESKIRKAVSPTYHAGHQLDISLLPCGPDLRMVERQIVYERTEKGFNMSAIDAELRQLFKTEFLPLLQTYDYVVIDCPPGISPLSEVAIRASDLVIVPTIPDFISVFGLRTFYKIFWKLNKNQGAPKQLPHVLVTRWEKNVRQHREIVERLEAAANLEVPAIRLLQTRVQKAAALAAALGSMDEEGSFASKYPTFRQKYGDEVISVLGQLVKEVKGVLHEI